MMSDYREQMLLYKNQYVYVKTGWTGNRTMVISNKPLSFINFMFSLSVEKYGKADISIADDVKSVKLFISDKINKISDTHSFIKENRVDNLKKIQVFT